MDRLVYLERSNKVWFRAICSCSCLGYYLSWLDFSCFSVLLICKEHEVPVKWKETKQNKNKEVVYLQSWSLTWMWCQNNGLDIDLQWTLPGVYCQLLPALFKKRSSQCNDDTAVSIISTTSVEQLHAIKQCPLTSFLRFMLLSLGLIDVHGSWKFLYGGFLAATYVENIPIVIRHIVTQLFTSPIIMNTGYCPSLYSHYIYPVTNLLRETSPSSNT